MPAIFFCENFYKTNNHYLNGNEDGFSSSPISLYKIPSEYEIKIQANITTNNPSVSPEIRSWGITWQTKDNKWIDLFNSPLRLDEIQNVKITIVNPDPNLDQPPRVIETPYFPIEEYKEGLGNLY